MCALSSLESEPATADISTPPSFASSTLQYTRNMITSLSSIISEDTSTSTSLSYSTNSSSSSPKTSVAPHASRSSVYISVFLFCVCFVCMLVIRFMYVCIKDLRKMLKIQNSVLKLIISSILLLNIACIGKIDYICYVLMPIFQLVGLSLCTVLILMIHIHKT